MPTERSPAFPLYQTSMVWLRRELRLHDHPALYQALRHSKKVYAVFVFDTSLLKSLPRRDRRVEFIWHGLNALQKQWPQLMVLHDNPVQCIPRMAGQLGVQAVWAHHDHEPQALLRDACVRGALAAQGMALHLLYDHHGLPPQHVLTQQGKPYSVFTPYRKAWCAVMHTHAHEALHDHTPETQAMQRLVCPSSAHPAFTTPPLPTLEALGFAPTNLQTLPLPPGCSGAQTMLIDFWERIEHYAQGRDYPAIRSPSYLGVHLRFGTLSVRELLRAAWPLHLQGQIGASTWLSELIWRDFYLQILAHFPSVVKQPFKPAFRTLAWEQGPQANAHFRAWCQGKTGYPLVDAAMLQLRHTGYMHNRLRMVVASFLTKHLGISWRRGEAFFARHLNDYELASNNGGWQWAASTGCDAQPWFRIFNPITQSEKFDSQGKFIRRYLPQLAKLTDAQIHAPWKANPIDLATADVVLGQNYPWPLVDHASARAAALLRYGQVRGNPHV